MGELRELQNAIDSLSRAVTANVDEIARLNRELEKSRRSAAAFDLLCEYAEKIRLTCDDRGEFEDTISDFYGEFARRDIELFTSEIRKYISDLDSEIRFARQIDENRMKREIN